MDIQELRGNIDRIDRQLIELFSQRMETSSMIAAYKKENRLPVYDPAREREILVRVCAEAGPELEDYARVLFQTLFDLSRSYQHSKSPAHNELTEVIGQAKETTPPLFPQRARVACQGVEGAYSQLACGRLFSAPDIMYCRTFEGVFQAVQDGLCEFGILPVENSSYGSVTAVCDLMRNYDFHIVRSLKLHIDHFLLAKPGTKMEDVKEIFSHEQAIGQCSRFLASLSGVKVTVCANTAEAAKMVSESDRADVASISSGRCASLYRLDTLSEHIQNVENNYTRFICIAKDLQIYPGAERVSMMITLPDTPGALYRMIARFAALCLNIIRIVSRPVSGRDSEFMFYLDVEASVGSKEVVSLLGELSLSGDHFRFLGNYSEVCV